MGLLISRVRLKSTLVSSAAGAGAGAAGAATGAADGMETTAGNGRQARCHGALDAHAVLALGDLDGAEAVFRGDLRKFPDLLYVHTHLRRAIAAL